MPIGADAFTCIDLDEHVRRILRINPEAGTVYPILHNINTVFNA